jgi:NAD(P)-dependent dehydrogenase (short-subunit alcohol dehydrogenase family)
MRDKKIALVTGANKGIGHEVVRQLARRDFHVFLAARNAEAGRAAADQLSGEGEVTFLEIDIADAESIRRAAEAFAGHSDRLDALVNNAGIMRRDDKSAIRQTKENFEETLRTNTLGPWLVAQAFLPFLRKSETPRIVNVSSSGGQLDGGADGWAPAYCVSKTGLNGVTVQLAAALPKFAVNSVCPGWVRTDMGGGSARLSVEEGADSLVWLASEAPQTLTAKFIKERKEIPW